MVRIPAVIAMLLLIDLIFGFLYLSDYAAGQPLGELTSFIDLNGEQNLPTWYSSVQWFLVAALLGVFAWKNVGMREAGSWLLLALPSVFLFFSLDEVAQIHEWLGDKSDILLPGSDRANTPFFHTGIWMFVLGLPFLAFFVALILSMRAYFRRAPGSLVRMFAGMAVMLAGTIGFETLHNFVDPGSIYGALQIAFEETCEMLGATLILWGSYELLRGHGLTWSLDRVDASAKKPAAAGSLSRPTPARV
jgi:hypothetical protein